MANIFYLVYAIDSNGYLLTQLYNVSKMSNFCNFFDFKIKIIYESVTIKNWIYKLTMLTLFTHNVLICNSVHIHLFSNCF